MVITVVVWSVDRVELRTKDLRWCFTSIKKSLPITGSTHHGIVAKRFLCKGSEKVVCLSDVYSNSSVGPSYGSG